MYNVTVLPAMPYQASQCSGEICWSKTIFEWPHVKACSGRFVCENISGNICGSYGLSFARKGQATSICQSRVNIAFDSLDKDERIEIEYWYHQSGASQEQESIQCYMWCSANGLEPIVYPSHPTLPTKLEKVTLLYNGMGISPHFLYAFNDSHIKKDMSCHADKCLSVYNLHWHNQNNCESNLVCPTLEGNICGDFALGVSYVTQSSTNTVTLCEKGEMLKQVLPPESKLVLYAFNNLRHFQRMRFECYMWCSYNILTDISEKDMQPSSLISIEESLVNNTYLSPVKIYKYLFNSTEPCLKRKCKETLDINWAHEDQCLLNVKCSSLGYHVCGQFGIVIGSTDICHENKLYKIPLNLNTSAITAWSTYNSQPNINCSLWCETVFDFNAKHSSMVSWNFVSSQLNNATISSVDYGSSITVSPYSVYNISSCQHKSCSLTFQWMRNSICQAKLLCRKLPKNVCGDYLVDMKSIDASRNTSSSQPICFEDYIYASNLNPIGSQINVDIKSMTTEDETMECYFWCSFDGIMPTKPIQAVWNYSAPVKEFNLTTSKQLTLSPNNIYRLKTSQEDCVESKCNTNIGIVQYMKKNQYINFFCLHLGFNVCGDFGVKLSNASTEICFTNVIYTFEMTSQFSLWDHKGNQHSIDCLLWGSDLPKQVPKHPMLDDLPFNLSWAETHSTSVSFEQAIDLSPTKLYHIHSNESLSKCNQSLCLHSLSLNWHWEEACIQSFYCTKVSSSICEDYGFLIDETPVCYQNHLYKYDLDYSSTLTFWNAIGASPEYDCYFWCHNDLAAMFWKSSIKTDLLLEIVSLKY